MNLETYQEIMSTLPGAFPASGRVEIEAIKKAWWPDLKDFEDQDLICGIGNVRRSARVFPSLGIVIDSVRMAVSERSARELEERLAEHRRKKQEGIGSYVPRDLVDPTEKNMATDTFRAIIDGLSSGPAGIADEMRRLADRYPKKRDWFLATAFLVEQDHKEAIERDEAINGAHRCPTSIKAEVVTILAEKVCQKCTVKIETGLWCSTCREALYKKTGDPNDAKKELQQVQAG